jgi:acyl carrier protein
LEVVDRTAELAALKNDIRRVVAVSLSVDAAALTDDSGPQSLEAWDSIAHLRLLLEIELEFHVRLTLLQMTQAKTITELADAVSDARNNHGG